MATSFLAKSLERQHIKSARKYSLQVIDINTALKDIHHQIGLHIDKSTYEVASNYVNQYISHTTIWNLKFACNLENPEVALMQIFHLKYILAHEQETHFSREREVLEEQRVKFRGITLYSDEHIAKRHDKMLQYIAENQN